MRSESSIDREDTISYPEDLRDAVDSYLEGLHFDHYPGTSGLSEAMRYSLLTGGKRIRPVLALATAEANAVEIELAMPIACAIELVHTMSLICDDLPVMDNHAVRRARPALHVVYGENIAILAGFGLYSEAIHLIEREVERPQHIIAVLREIIRVSCSRGMVSGQYLDLTAGNIDAEQLRQIHELKTGRLFEAAVRCVLSIGEASEMATSAYRTFAKELGILFQITDDILDVTGSEVELGKTVGDDKRLGRNSYVSFYGLEGAKKLASTSYERARSALDVALRNAPGPGDDLIAIADYVYRASPKLIEVPS